MSADQDTREGYCSLCVFVLGKDLEQRYTHGDTRVGQNDSRCLHMMLSVLEVKHMATDAGGGSHSKLYRAWQKHCEGKG